MRAFARWLSRLVLTTFFRRIERVGEESVPADGPVVFALNHPNGLLDPLFILAFAPAQVSFMAKEPLFRTPLVRHFVRAFDCLPVYRRQDGADPGRNRETLEAARDLLGRGGSIAIFPEGTTHREPGLLALKTGAARLALSARALLASRGGTPVRLVPVGLYYTDRGTFRSDAVVVYGEALEVPLVTLDEAAEAPRDAARELTGRLDTALRGLTLNAGRADLVALAATAARLLEDRVPGLSPDSPPVHRRLELMRAILEGHEHVCGSAPERLAVIIGRLRTYQQVLGRAGLGGQIPRPVEPGRALAHLVKTVAGLLVLLPLVVVGLVENALPYQLVGRLARRAARDEEEVLSTLKVLLGFALYPATWLALSVAAGLAWGWAAGAAHLLLAPLCARAALWFLERADATTAGARVLWLTWVHRHRHERMAAERDALVAELLDLASAPPPARGGTAAR